MAEALLDELVIPLRKPVTIGDTSYAELRLREPTAGEWAIWDKLEGIDLEIKAVSVVAAVPETAVRQLPAREFKQAAKYIGAFLA